MEPADAAPAIPKEKEKEKLPQKPPARIAYYRSEDPVSNLRLQVEVRCVRSAPLQTAAADAAAAPQQTGDSAPLLQGQPGTTAAPGAKYSATINWQQKIYGQKEIATLTNTEHKSGYPSQGEPIYTYVGMWRAVLSELWLTIF